jgi:hypothetical protein
VILGFDLDVTPDKKRKKVKTVILGVDLDVEGGSRTAGPVLKFLLLANKAFISHGLHSWLSPSGHSIHKN